MIVTLLAVITLLAAFNIWIPFKCLKGFDGVKHKEDLNLGLQSFTIQLCLLLHRDHTTFFSYIWIKCMLA